MHFHTQTNPATSTVVTTSNIAVSPLWAKVGRQVSNDMSPIQMCEAVGADWTVEKFPLFYPNANGEMVAIDDKALIRTSDMTVFDTISDDWKPVQNETAFGFFNDFVMAGDMEMVLGGVLDGGKRVWAMAKLLNPVEIIPGDFIQPYMLFSNPHHYGAAVDIRLCNVRLISGSSYLLGLRDATNVVKINHRTEFDADRARKAIGVAQTRLDEYARRAKLLAQRKASRDEMIAFLKRTLPATGAKKEEDRLSRGAEKTLELIDTMPGADLGRDTWWQAVSAVGYYVDNHKGRTQQTRLNSAWFGPGSNDKERAMKIALEMALNKNKN